MVIPVGKCRADSTGRFGRLHISVEDGHVELLVLDAEPEAVRERLLVAVGDREDRQRVQRGRRCLCRLARLFALLCLSSRRYF